ncbi:MAG: hydroxylamine reductase [Deltaproteobacteria bacterium]|nr:hydroxylamine reductase [Deltaproteobacteria bacterium]
MFCYQCQEAARCYGCETKGVCGKNDDTSALMDLLIYSTKGLAQIGELAGLSDEDSKALGRFISCSLFQTITNANFDKERFLARIKETFSYADSLVDKFLAYHQKSKGEKFEGSLSECITWRSGDEAALLNKGRSVGVQSEANEDLRSLKELVVYGLKGVCAYYEHAAHLGFEDVNIAKFIISSLAAVGSTNNADALVAMVMKVGENAVSTMALLDKGHNETYGKPEITKVNIGVGTRPGILISGHDLKDMAQLLEQSKDAGVDVYTHSEMLPAHYYPAFKKYKHFVGNYGGSWWAQNAEFEKFNGPILMTTNCIVPVRPTYANRIFTTGMAGYPGVKHIAADTSGQKDFSEIIALAKSCAAPIELEKGEIVGGFAHDQVLALAEKVIDAVKSGAVKKFVVMAGCDGRLASRSYYTNFAQELPKDTVILTAGCAKYRYNKLNLGDIGGIPRVLDAGQCNDSFSLAVVALKLKEVFGLNDINELPIVYNIAWYEQKAVAVLLALLCLGVKNIRLGPTLPAFLSPNITNVLVEKFGLKGINSVSEDMKEVLA